MRTTNLLQSIEVVDALPSAKQAGVLYLVNNDDGFAAFVAGHDGQSGYLNGLNDNAAFATRTLLAAQLSFAHGDMAFLTEAGREGQFKYSSANLSANVTADTLQGVYIAPTVDTSGASGAWVRVINDNTVNVLWFGAVADNATDNLAAFNGAAAWAKTRGSITISNPIGGGRIIIPGLANRYYLSANWLIQDFSCTIEGSGGICGGIPTYLRFPASCTGIKFVNSAGSLIKGIGIIGPGGVNSTPGTYNILYCGIWATCAIKVEQCFVSGFAGPAYYIDGTATNANTWQIDGLRVQYCSGSGLLIDGADSNAGISIGVNATSCLRYGIEDSSFLGNEHYGIQIENMTLGAYITDASNNARCVFSGYTETGQPAGDLGAQSIGMGPQFAGTTGGTFLIASGLDGGGLNSSTGFYSRRINGSTIVRTRWGYNPAAEVAADIAFSSNSGASYDWTWKMAENANGLSLFGGDGSSYIHFAIGTVPQFNFGRGSNVTNAINIKGLFIGDGNSGRQVDFAAAAPITGEHAKGDVVWNNGVTGANDAIDYWRCSVAGTPGTWVARP